MKRLMKPYMGMARTACFSTFTITQGEHSYYCLCCVHVYKWASLIIKKERKRKKSIIKFCGQLNHSEIKFPFNCYQTTSGSPYSTRQNTVSMENPCTFWMQKATIDYKWLCTCFIILKCSHSIHCILRLFPVLISFWKVQKQNWFQNVSISTCWLLWGLRKADACWCFM